MVYDPDKLLSTLKENCNRKIELYIPDDDKMVRGRIKNAVLGKDLVVTLQHCEIEERGSVRYSVMYKVRLPPTGAELRILG